MEFSQPPIETVELQTGPDDQDPVATVIWLHGLGSDGNDFVPIIEEFKMSDGVRFVFPHAPIRPITLNYGYMMRGWYDLASLEMTDQQDVAGIQNSMDVLVNLVDREIQAGIAPEKIIIAGFSQGGAIALHTGLRINQPIAGVIGLSTYLPLADTLDAEKSQYRPPILMAHGTQDDIVRFDYGKTSKDLLVEKGYSVDWFEYPMPHTVCKEEVDEVAYWLKKQLGFLKP